MRWRRSTQTALPPIAAAPVPSTEVLRAAALRASWRRDRAVGRRRVAWRWTLWYAQRWGPHALGLSMVVLLVAQWWWPWVPAVRSPQADLAHAPDMPLPQAKQVNAVTLTNADADAVMLPSPQGTSSLQLGLTGFLAPKPADGVGSGLKPNVPTAPHPVQAEPFVPAPTLKFETWLHSKEI